MVPDPVTHGIHNHNANTRLTHFIPPEKDPWEYRKRPVTWNWLMCWIVILIGYVWTPRPEVFYKNRYSYKFRKNSQENTRDRVFFTKLQASNLQFYKRDSVTGVFHWILWKILRIPLSKNTSRRLLLICSELAI